VDRASMIIDRPPGGWSDLATHRDLDALEAGLDRRFAEVDRRFITLEASLDRRFAEVDRRFTGLEQNLRNEISSARDRAFARHLRWTVGTMIGLMAVVIAALRN
jgi:hypothetical protein